MDLKQERNAEDGSLACQLPFSLLELIVSHLGPRDKAALALTHSTFATFLRTTRKRCAARVADRQQLKMLSLALENHKALESLNIIFLEDKPLLSSLSFMSPTTTSLELQFRGEHPTKRSLSWLNSNLFSSVQRLCLGAGRSSARNRRLNDGQQLSILVGLPSLTYLELVNLHSDRGLEKVTQLQTLRIVYPNHAADAPPDPICPSCMILHEDNWIDYLMDAAEKENVVIGEAISFLPHLQTLTLDFNAQNDEMSFSSLVNHFYWRNNPNAFPALERISFLNTLNFDEFFYPIPFELGNFVTSGYFTICSGFTLAICYEKIPSLQHWELHTNAEWMDRHIISLDNKKSYNWNYVNDENGDVILDFVPVKAEVRNNKNIATASEE